MKIFSTGWDVQKQTLDILNRCHSYDSAFVCKRKRIDWNEQLHRRVTRDGPDEQEDANCWGKVTSDFTTQRDGDGGGGQVFGQHSSDPVGGDSDNETPREGVGNQDEDHPSDHADTVGPRFGSDEECAED
jgi:hypothetical protein